MGDISVQPFHYNYLPADHILFDIFIHAVDGCMWKEECMSRVHVFVYKNKD